MEPYFFGSVLLWGGWLTSHDDDTAVNTLATLNTHTHTPVWSGWIIYPKKKRHIHFPRRWAMLWHEPSWLAPVFLQGEVATAQVISWGLWWWIEFLLDGKMNDRTDGSLAYTPVGGEWSFGQAAWNRWSLSNISILFKGHLPGKMLQGVPQNRL